MSKLLVDKTLVKFAGKKLLGRAHTSNAATLVNETIPSNVQMTTALTFGEAVPNTATKTFFQVSNGSVEYVEFDIDPVSGTDYDEDATSGFGGPESSDNTEHGYVLKLPSNYSTNSGNTANRGTGVFVNGKVLHESAGKLQLVPPYLSNAISNPYYLALYDQTGARINDGDFIDWTVDYYNGVIFVQDPQTSKVPTKARAFLYIGKYADEVITESTTQITVKDEGSNITTAASSFNFVGAAVVASNSGNDVTVTLSSDVYSRTAVTSTITSSVSDKILGVSASAAIDIRLPAASGFVGGQTFTIKDEAGNANTNNITIKTAGSDTIDGTNFIVLESPYSAVNLYSDGSSKFFIY
jgi:hypothetical protein